MALPQALANLASHVKKGTIHRIIRSAYGVDPRHLHMSKNLWTMALWNADEVPYLREHPSRVLHNLDKLFAELQATDRPTTARPEQLQLITAGKILKYDQRYNILTNVGMTEIAKRGTAESASTNTYHHIGTGTTAESLNDTGLEAHVAAKTIGTRQVLEQTERYGSVFTADEAGIGNNIAEAGVSNYVVGTHASTIPGASGGPILLMRVTSDPFSIIAGRLFSVQTNISHANGDVI